MSKTIAMRAKVESDLQWFKFFVKITGTVQANTPHAAKRIVFESAKDVVADIAGAEELQVNLRRRSPNKKKKP